MLTDVPILVGGTWLSEGAPLEVRSPATGELVGTTFEATAEQLDTAADAAVDAQSVMRRLPSSERGAILRRIAAGLDADQEELARLLTAENGKPLGDTRTEVARTAAAFRISGEEAERLGGEVLPLDQVASARGRWGLTRQVAIGPVAGIAPFNVPLSLAAHKLGPAIAAGNSIVLKPDSRVALSALHMARIMDDAGVPRGALSMLPMDRAVGDGLVTDDRFRLLSFTGSARVGWAMRARAGTKKVVLELGGNAPLIVDETADIPRAVERAAVGGFKYAGQLCISVQRILVHEDVYDEFLARLLPRVKELRVGDPFAEDTDYGPMIDDAAADRVMAWVDEAVEAGARVLAGGHRRGRYVDPLVLERVPPAALLSCDEAFGPVVTVQAVSSFAEAVDVANASPYGLQAGVFTRDLQRALRAFDDLEVGGVVVNDIPTFRVDNMPYGGVKESGLGREGIRWALQDMTETRLLVLVPEEDQ